VEFFSTDYDLLRIFYHRVIAISAPVYVVVVSERGGLDPYLIGRFQNVFDNHAEVYIRRAFKAEDVPITIDSMGDNDLIVIDPYHHRKNYTKIVSSLRKVGVGSSCSVLWIGKERVRFSVHTLLTL